MMIKTLEIKKEDHGVHHGCPPEVNVHGQL